MDKVISICPVYSFWEREGYHQQVLYKKWSAMRFPANKSIQVIQYFKITLYTKKIHF